MTVTPAGESSFDARRCLRGVGALAAVGGAQVAAVLVLGQGVPCPFRAMTGVSCPLCGTTTAALCLLRGDLAAAWHANAFSVLLLAGLVVCVVCWLVEACGGPALRPPGRLRGLWGDRLLAVLAVLAVVFGTARLAL